MNDYTITVPEEDLVLAVEALKVHQGELKETYHAFEERDPWYAQVCYDNYARVTNLIEQLEALL